MGRVTQQSIDEVRSRADIVAEVERHVRLTKAGRSYKGLSPFTSEKTASFYVDPAKGAYYCFSSNQGGDVIRFVMAVEHLTFGEALEVLASRYNIDLTYENGAGPGREERSARMELLDIHEAAADYFHHAFLAENDLAAKVRAYWTDERHFTLEVAKDFRIGFEPPGDSALLQMLLKKGHAPAILLESGIFTAREGSTNPGTFRSRFRGRLIVPIREASQGQVIAFTARKLFCTPGADTLDLSKYVNSPGTPLFHKSHVLFNLDRAQKAVRSDPAGFMMVEGQLDTIRCYTSGFEATVAGQGTSITDEQLHILKRHSDLLRVLLDGDAAGQKAALRLMPMAFAAGLEPRFAVLPAGRDPDSLIASDGPEALRAVLEAALSPMQFLARTLKGTPEYQGAHGLSAAMRKATEILSSLESEVARAEYLRELAAIMGFDFQAALADMTRFSLRGAHATARAEAPRPAASMENNAFGRLKTPESEIWYLLLRHGELALPLASAAEDHWIDASTLEGRLLGRLFWEFRDGETLSVSDFVSAVKEDDERNFLYSLTMASREMEDETPSQDADNLLERLFISFRKRRILEIDSKVASLPTGSDLLEPLLREKVSLSRTFKQLPCLKVRVG
jgi:DNA primase